MNAERTLSPLHRTPLPLDDPPDIVYSVVIPLYNDAKTLPVLHERVSAVMTELGEPYEIIYVDDGSQDGTGRCGLW